MKKELREALKNAMREEFLKSRQDMCLNQDRFSDCLYMSERSYVDLEGGKSLCSFMTFLFFAAKCHRDPVAMLTRLVKIVDEFANVNPEDVVSRSWAEKVSLQTPAPVVQYKGHGDEPSYPICVHCGAPIARDYQRFCGNCSQALDWAGFTDETVSMT